MIDRLIVLSRLGEDFVGDGGVIRDREMNRDRDRDRERKTLEALKAGERVRCCCCWEGLCTLLPMALMGDDDQRGWMMVGQWGLLTFLLSVPCVLLYLLYCSYLCALQKKKETDFIIRLFQYKNSETKWLC